MSSASLPRDGPSPRIPGHVLGKVSEVDARGRKGTTVIHQAQPCLPLSNLLKEDDILLLLTPGVAPSLPSARSGLPGLPMDPFEPLGRALARHHPKIRHVPYLPRNGITGT